MNKYVNITLLIISSFYVFPESKDLLPNLHPLNEKGIIIRIFGENIHPISRHSFFSNAIEYIANELKVYSTGEGQIALVTLENGNYEITIDHPNNFQTIYRGLKNVTVTVGDLVQAMQEIGTAGIPNIIGTPSLIYKMKFKDQFIDPELIMSIHINEIDSITEIIENRNEIASLSIERKHFSEQDYIMTVNEDKIDILELCDKYKTELAITNNTSVIGHGYDEELQFIDNDRYRIFTNQKQNHFFILITDNSFCTNKNISIEDTIFEVIKEYGRTNSIDNDANLSKDSFFRYYKLNEYNRSLFPEQLSYGIVNDQKKNIVLGFSFDENLVVKNIFFDYWIYDL